MMRALNQTTYRSRGDRVPSPTMRLFKKAFLRSLLVMVSVIALGLSIPAASGKTSDDEAAAIAILRETFANPPVTKDFVFRRTTASNDETLIFQCRSQANAFVVRELSAMEDADEEKPAAANILAGGFGNVYWSVEFNHSIVASNIARLSLDVVEARSSYISRQIIRAPLLWGIQEVEPLSVRWAADGSLTGKPMTPEFGKVTGKMVNQENGRPKEVRYEFANQPAAFVAEYVYDDSRRLGVFPSTITLWREYKGVRYLGSVYETLRRVTNATPLDLSWFEPEKYFKVDGSVAESGRLVYDGGESFVIYSDGAKVPTTKAPLPARWKLTVLPKLFLVTIVGLIFAAFWMFRRFRKQTTPKSL